jgi:hypothetical protein
VGPASTSLTRFTVRATAQLPIRPGVSLFHQSQIQPVLEDPSDYLLTTETALRVIVLRRLAVQTSFVFNRDTSPPAGVSFRNDRTLTVGFVIDLAS